MLPKHHPLDPQTALRVGSSTTSASQKRDGKLRVTEPSLSWTTLRALRTSQDSPQAGLSVPEGRGPVASDPGQQAWHRLREGGRAGLAPPSALPSPRPHPASSLPLPPNRSAGRGRPWGLPTAPSLQRLSLWTPPLPFHSSGWNAGAPAPHGVFSGPGASPPAATPGAGLRGDTRRPARKAGEGGLEASSPVRLTPRWPDGPCPPPGEDSRQQPFWALRVPAGQGQTQAGKHLPHTEHTGGSLSPRSSQVPGLQKCPLSRGEAGTHLHTPACTRLPSPGAGSPGAGWAVPGKGGRAEGRAPWSPAH